MNCGPSSEDMSPGTPKQIIQWRANALAQDSVSMEASGMVNLSTNVNR